MLPCQFPGFEFFIFLEGVVFTDVDVLIARTAWYFWLWALGPTQLGKEIEASLVNGGP